MRKKHEDRAYQDEIVDAVFDYLFTKSGNPVVASPGGTGKSHVMNRIIKRMVTEWPGTRVLSLVHDAKVIDQNCNAMLHYWPQAPVGVYSAGLKLRDTRNPVIYGGIQSVARRIADFGKINVVIIDECDLVSPKEETLYQKTIACLQEINPKLRVIGFTATPYRLGMGCLTNTDLWDEICIDLTKTERFNWFVEHGYLSPLVTKKACAEIDITNISMKGGEFNEKEMQEVADTDELNRAVVSECIRYGKDRKHWLVFSTGVKHGHKLAKLFNSKGVPTIMLSGEDSMAYREEMEDRFRAGEFRCLVNCGLYGRGWDFPALDMLAWARATQSVSLWVQGCVRLTRTAPGKENGLVLDFAGNTRRLGPVNDPVVPAPRRKGDKEKGEAPVKECPQCHSYIHTRIMVCPDCGYEFPPPQAIKKTASTDDIMRKSRDTTPHIEEFEVLNVIYRTGTSGKGNNFLKVTYSIGTAHFNEFLFFESDSAYVKRILKSWWTYRKGELPIPNTVDEAVERAKTELVVPRLVRVNTNTGTKYPDVVGVEVDDDSKVPEPEEKPDYNEDDDIPF